MFRFSSFLLLLFLVAVLLFVRLGATPIYILDEAKNAQCAREMLQRNDFIVPTFNENLRTDKPPLHYFFMMLSYKIFGVNEFAARFFSAVMGLITIVSLYFFSKKFLGESAAIFATLVLITSTHFLFEFRLAVPDPYLICFESMGIFAGFTWLQKKKITFLYTASISFALATLAKGPVALALPAFCFFAWIVYKKRWKTFLTWHLISAFLVLCIITLPWYIAVDKATAGEWTKGFFIDNNFNRFSNPQEGHGGSFLLPLIFVFAGLLPFSIFSGEVIKNRKKVFANELVQFSFFVSIIFILFFSICSTKLINYPMPCYPFAAIILGKYLSLLFEEKFSLKNYTFFILIFILVLIPLAGYFAIGKEAEAAQLKSLAFWLLIPAIIFIFFLSGLKQKKQKIFALLLSYTLFNIIGLWFIYPKLYKQNPVAKTINVIKKQNPVFAYKIYNAGYNFYLDKKITQFLNSDSLKKALIKNPDAIVISRLAMYDSIKGLSIKIIASQHDIFELPTTIVLKADAKP